MDGPPPLEYFDKLTGTWKLVEAVAVPAATYIGDRALGVASSFLGLAGSYSGLRGSDDPAEDIQREREIGELFAEDLRRSAARRGAQRSEQLLKCRDGICEDFQFDMQPNFPLLFPWDAGYVGPPQSYAGLPPVLEDYYQTSSKFDFDGTNSRTLVARRVPRLDPTDTQSEKKKKKKKRPRQEPNSSFDPTDTFSYKYPRVYRYNYGSGTLKTRYRKKGYFKVGKYGRPVL